LSGVTIFDLTIFDLFDFVTAKFIMPIGGMFIAIFTGWYLERNVVRMEVTNNGKLIVPFFKFYIFLLKFVAPIGIGMVFINELFK
jgi:NSS family neurotransmitter:Na+ symporter